MLETNAVSVERLKEYTQIDQEADWDSNNTPHRCFVNIKRKTNLFNKGSTYHYQGVTPCHFRPIILQISKLIIAPDMNMDVGR